MQTGRCNCGGVRFEVREERDTVLFCHCSICRRFSGHHWATTQAKLEDIRFHSDATLKSFASSDDAERGFCDPWGSPLFYRPKGADHMGISAGSLDRPTGMVPLKHIFTADKGDYYGIADDVPQVPD